MYVYIFALDYIYIYISVKIVTECKWKIYDVAIRTLHLRKLYIPVGSHRKPREIIMTNNFL